MLDAFMTPRTWSKRQRLRPCFPLASTAETGEGDNFNFSFNLSSFYLTVRCFRNGFWPENVHVLCYRINSAGFVAVVVVVVVVLFVCLCVCLILSSFFFSSFFILFQNASSQHFLFVCLFVLSKTDQSK